MIQGILEPLKVRVISKGPAVPYYAVKSVQKAMNKAIRGISCFSLTGKTFDVTSLIPLMEKAEPGFEWASVDYSGATDNLSWKYSGPIFERIIHHLPREIKGICRLVLGMHELHYPPGTDFLACKTHGSVVDHECDGHDECYDCRMEGDPLSGMQTSGQLMGSPLSFPVLCLANIGVYLRNCQDFQVGWSDEERLGHVLVNGDDMIYACPPRSWATHIEIARRVGLEMSPGKSYLHSTYGNINSAAFHYPIGRANATPERIPFLNMGLFVGQHKVADAEPPPQLKRQRVVGDGQRRPT